ncbi:hypothetical protein HNQ94_003290 [Salirhabdus euzebyi]|uniref:Uncharacterized protein n=1 Tax=Salirhabdus euzebyi TaxID=394506 RepID=A0A841Q8K8_9BACI|nr:hypothetical protein [Salirhabdus euzebyi]MBB6454801.1 hypothetical protein [Salirhabdus euzebyi]
MRVEKKIEAILWNVALPGFSQLLQKRYLVGFIFIFMEILLNIFSNFNLAIRYSFLGQIDMAIAVTNYQYLMFYPCLYMFAIWDAYKVAEEEHPSPYMFLPFAVSAYFVTVGLMYSDTWLIFGVLLGPVWLPILCLIPGLAVGFIIRFLLVKNLQKNEAA